MRGGLRVYQSNSSNDLLEKIYRVVSGLKLYDLLIRLVLFVMKKSIFFFAVSIAAHLLIVRSAEILNSSSSYVLDYISKAELKYASEKISCFPMERICMYI